jgi:Protein of unknown function (DUF2726)
VNKITTMFRDDGYSGNERKHYSWLKSCFPETNCFVYPNVALQVIINPDAPDVKRELITTTEFLEPLDMMWCPSNFFANSSVDLCVIKKSDYLPLIAFELDNRSHDEGSQAKRDELKDLIFKKAGIVFRRLSVRGKTEEQKKDQFKEATSSAKKECTRSIEGTEDLQGKRSILDGDGIRETFDKLNDMFAGDEYAVFPNVALRSIFAQDQIASLPTPEKRLCNTSLVDFCIVGVESLRPIVAFSLRADKLQSKVFNSFGLPLLHLRNR